MATDALQVYILKNRMNRRFIACSEDPEAELKAHNQGKFRGTKAFKPWRMEWYSEPLTRNNALRLEEELRHHKTNAAMLESITRKHDMGIDKL